jgi:hypothetical protein
MLVLLVTNGADVIPKIAEVNAITHKPFISPVVSNVPVAVPASGRRDLRAFESFRFPLREIEQRVVGRVKRSSARETVLHGDCYPMSKGSTSVQDIGKSKGPTRYMIEV